jgi:hypothetical protein
MGLGLFAMAALAVASNSAFAGHTAAEVLMFLGDGVVNPDGTEAGSFTEGGTPMVDALPGDVVAFPVYVRVTPGDGAHGLAGYGLDAWTESTQAGLITGASMSVGGIAGWSGASAAGTYDGATVSGTHTRLVKRAYDSVATVSEALPISGNSVLAGWLTLAVSGGAMDGDMVELRLGVGEGAAAGASGFALNPTLSPVTVAFGFADAADGIGGMNTYRFGVPTADVLGTTLQHRSTLIDGKINIIPEPATMGLLGLGLLAIRRRRA